MERFVISALGGQGSGQVVVPTYLAIVQDQGLLAVPAAENVVRLLPPLIAEESHMEAALEILDRVCAEAAEGA